MQQVQLKKTNTTDMLNKLFETIIKLCGINSLIFFASNESRLMASPFERIVSLYFQTQKVSDFELYEEYRWSGICLYLLKPHPRFFPTETQIQ